ncbi:putative meiotically up-regulated gene 82 protein [[Candida] railenensis]|uniref:Meiotically up-regulated gene 82 protein n=1 Tax=[Candida] railenensis TaxID=45579 RepID=A0A9P0QKP2_9ASCO|nr:putative meiotically up-regulated gene 82 protein [[Candida] railenensis]
MFNISRRSTLIPVFSSSKLQTFFSRLNSQFSESQIEQAKKWLEDSTANSIPKHEFDITYSRSSGPGGQKVNKTSSKASVSLDPKKWLTSSCYWIPQPIQHQLLEKKIRYQTKFGGLLIQCDTHRNREVNTVECFSRLLEEIKSKTHFAEEVSEEDLAKWEEISKERAEKIKFQKKRQSDKKKSRSKKFDI